MRQRRPTKSSGKGGATLASPPPDTGSQEPHSIQSARPLEGPTAGTDLCVWAHAAPPAPRHAARAPPAAASPLECEGFVALRLKIRRTGAKKSNRVGSGTARSRQHTCTRRPPPSRSPQSAVAPQSPPPHRALPLTYVKSASVGLRGGRLCHKVRSGQITNQARAQARSARLVYLAGAEQEGPAHNPWSTHGPHPVYSLAIMADGAVWSWGRGGFGRLGHGDTCAASITAALARGAPFSVARLPRLRTLQIDELCGFTCNLGSDELESALGAVVAACPALQSLSVTHGAMWTGGSNPAPWQPLPTATSSPPRAVAQPLEARPRHVHGTHV